MNDYRRTLEASLKQLTMPLLRQLGLKGSYPHFYRERHGHIDLLSFQFRQDGTSFIVEISFADTIRRNVYFRPEETPIEKLRVSVTTKRYRLGSAKKLSVDGEWLQLVPSHGGTSANHSSKLAIKVNDLVVTEAEPWWEAHSNAT